MNIYIYRNLSFNNLHETTKCDIASIRTPEGLAINNDMLSKGDLIFDMDGSCGVVKTIVNNLFTVLVVSKINKYNKSNINSTINRI